MGMDISTLENSLILMGMMIWIIPDSEDHLYFIHKITSVLLNQILPKRDVIYKIVFNESLFCIGNSIYEK